MKNKSRRLNNVNGKFSLIILLLITFSSAFTAAAQVTTFNNSTGSINLSFPTEYLTNDFLIKVPNGTVTDAKMRIQGFNLNGQKGLPVDVVLVTDTSGSMGCLPGQTGLQ